MEKRPVPNDILQQLKCNLCGEFLSYPPITLHAETGSVCGRCPALEAERDIIPLREINYEKIADNFFLFPCRYQLQGCNERFSITEIPNHEKFCNLKPFFCPVMPLGSCHWQGTPNEAHFHFLNDHPDFMMQSSVFELDLVTWYSRNELLSHHDTLFLVHQEKTDDDIFFCVVYQINNYDMKKFDYFLQFKSGDGHKKFQVGEKKVPLFNNDISREHGFKVNVPIIKDTLDSPTLITCTIDISEAALEILETIDIDSDENKENLIKEDNQSIKSSIVEDDKMLLDLECPVCQEFMVPPIFQCQTGHSVCGVCKPQLRECPSCRGTLAETRNFTLEKLTEHIMYPCKNRFDGCSFKANCNEIRKHESFCLFSPIKCPLNEFCECAWKGLNKKLISHMKIEHPEHLAQKNDRLVLEIEILGDDAEGLMIVNMFDENFRLRIQNNEDKNKFYATAQIIGDSEQARKFLYEVNIIDLNNKMQDIRIRRYCGSINDKKNNTNHCTTLQHDLIQQLAFDGKIEAHFRILKI